jgi:hypothetical protein
VDILLTPRSVYVGHGPDLKEVESQISNLKQDGVQTGLVEWLGMDDGLRRLPGHVGRAEIGQQI